MKNRKQFYLKRLQALRKAMNTPEEVPEGEPTHIEPTEAEIYPPTKRPKQPSYASRELTPLPPKEEPKEPKKPTASQEEEVPTAAFDEDLEQQRSNAAGRESLNLAQRRNHRVADFIQSLDDVGINREIQRIQAIPEPPERWDNRQWARAQTLLHNLRVEQINRRNRNEHATPQTVGHNPTRSQMRGLREWEQTEGLHLDTEDQRFTSTGVLVLSYPLNPGHEAQLEYEEDEGNILASLAEEFGWQAELTEDAAHIFIPPCQPKPLPRNLADSVMPMVKEASTTNDRQEYLAAMGAIGDFLEEQGYDDVDPELMRYLRQANPAALYRILGR